MFVSKYKIFHSNLKRYKFNVKFKLMLGVFSRVSSLPQTPDLEGVILQLAVSERVLYNFIKHRRLSANSKKRVKFHFHVHIKESDKLKTLHSAMKCFYIHPLPSLRSTYHPHCTVIRLWRLIRSWNIFVMTTDRL